MNYGKYYFIMAITGLFFGFFIIITTKSLETTWSGIYNPNKHIALEYKFQYSKTYFKKSQCENWVKKMKENRPEGQYICGKNCTFIGTGLLDCEQMYRY